MKKLNYLIVLALSMSIQAQVGINTNTPDPSAILDVNASNKGFLPPRMSSAQRSAIQSPAKALMVYNTTEKCLEVNLGDGISPDWNCLPILAQNSGIVSMTQEFIGEFTQGVAMNGSELFRITLMNSGTNPEPLSFSPSDISFTGVTGISISSVSPTSLTLAPGDSIQVDYSFAGTPSEAGDFQVNWVNGDLSETTQGNTSPGRATFDNLPIQLDVFSMRISEVTLDTNDDILGIVDNGTNKITVEVPYTEGVGSYLAYEGVYVQSNTDTGEEADVNSFRISYPAGNFSSSGSILVTIEVDGDGMFEAEMQSPNSTNPRKNIANFEFNVNGVNKGNLVLDVFGGVLDRRFAESSQHDFIYVPKKYADGNFWLSTNLGAEYSKLSSPQFDPTISLEGETGLNRFAAGSHFQWGRFSDGHELVNSPTISGFVTYVNGATTTLSTTDSPATNEFIRAGVSPSDWRSPANDNLWQGVNGINNPCPVGFRVPTISELQELISAEDINDRIDALSRLNMGFSGFRNYSTGGNSSTNSGSSYYSSTTAAGGRVSSFFLGNSTIQFRNTERRAAGNLVRCIKD